MLLKHKYDIQPISTPGESTTLSNLSLVAMPNLVTLSLWDINIPGSTLPTNMLYNLPGLERLYLSGSNVEVIPDGFFNYSTSCLNIILGGNKIHAIDLGGLSPNANVDLDFNKIIQLPEKNFRPFVENVLQTPNSVGNIDLFGEY